jgi:hypothetical protein
VRLEGLKHVLLSITHYASKVPAVCDALLYFAVFVRNTQEFGFLKNVTYLKCSLYVRLPIETVCNPMDWHGTSIDHSSGNVSNVSSMTQKRGKEV